MTAQQRKVIFGLSKGLNIDKDNLHILVNGLTGCESLTELTDVQADGVIRELRSRMWNGQPFTVGERMTGAIKKILGTTAVPGKDIFKWVSFEDGTKLIEGLKRYVVSAERRAEKGA